ncbi:MAG: pyruvate carboxylase [Planctomycetaceae bacterium]|nr:pyruvate carboxylase [Planctomycetaceae bacterium]
MQPIQKLLVANRSEIAIRVFRSATELGIRTVAIYSHEDRYALHRFKADEAYRIGKPGEPIRSYLDIPAIVALAKDVGVDAIHPGYGFLSERPEFAKACAEAGIKFVGPSVHCLEALGDKTAARNIAIQAGVPVLGGTKESIETLEEARTKAEEIGFPVMIKAAKGGGGRGMRAVKSAADFDQAFESARNEARTAFGSPEVFLEKFISRAKHIEVQLLGDEHGNLVHLYERDCSVQRRHQKVVELAPAPNLSQKLRDGILDAALKIGRAVNYSCAGTVEFLVDVDAEKFYFIEVNPRIQVEHTVTEEITNIDIVKCQILVAQGKKLADDDIGLGDQGNVKLSGFAVQCRVTTEDPANNFMPDYGRVTHYRSAGGMGIRLDAGSAFSGAVVNPFYDSLLTKVTTRGRRFIDAIHRMERTLKEFRIRGVKTNIPFLSKVMAHQTFVNGDCTTRFIDETPELFQFDQRQNRATRLLSYLAETIVNGNALVKGRPKSQRREPAPVPSVPRGVQPPKGTRDKLKELGATGFAKWVLEQKRLLITDTTFRDAHQSLLATRMRTFDLLQISDAYAHYCSEMFSLEMWGGATFDTSMRFLKECPWQRLVQMRERVPNILFQMLLRSSNAVGYTNYPDNIVQVFVKEAADAGIDVFRIFDCLNWLPNMKVAMDAVVESGAICEAAICYTGDITNPKRTKYSLKYYVDLAKQLEKMGAHILAIKDMAGLCKPAAASQLIKALKQEIGIPIHFHTHDTAGIQAASIMQGAQVNLDIADAAMAPMSGGTSQVNLNTLVEMLKFGDRDTALDSDRLDTIAEYWRSVREFYTPFESVALAATADLYRHEMPGGQYTNLFEQARALGLADRWPEVCRLYADVNQLFGDIVKVTPTSKSVGDMALFMLANNLTCEDVLNPDRDIAFPGSVIDLIGGGMGQPPGGFPEAVRKRILLGKQEFVGRPGETLPPADMAAAKKKVQELLGREPNGQEVISWLLYERVYEEFAKHEEKYADVSILPTPNFFFGLEVGEEISIDIEPGKTLIIRLLTVSDAHADGTRTVFFELNGQPREITLADNSIEATAEARVKADPAIAGQVGATMPGMVVTVAVKIGDRIKKGQKLLSLEAMKMETTINADLDGKIRDVLVQPGRRVETGDLLVVIEPEA